MSSGSLRKRIAFDRRAQADDAYGNVEGAWEQQCILWARVTPLKGTETVVAERLQGSQPVVIRVRFSRQAAAISHGWRARDSHSGQTYNITAAANMDERRQFIDLLAVAGGADG